MNLPGRLFVTHSAGVNALSLKITDKGKPVKGTSGKSSRLEFFVTGEIIKL